ncbi:hypothetical protein T4A_3509 [Trichinella pseudospiralis]|uniref:Uncharacterized protein n=1 Tax=Trichinella pseudospiralis TaxID=6337 RepID=A0A0V1EM98_TRIPS|nr:hypothetical protein T4E_7805 [Trichinella pseudospiralis]KRY74099.1 hypothetical protein T4A_3509 [Trichinella pseudospiralis]
MQIDCNIHKQCILTSRPKSVRIIGVPLYLLQMDFLNCTVWRGAEKPSMFYTFSLDCRIICDVDD